MVVGLVWPRGVFSQFLRIILGSSAHSDRLFYLPTSYHFFPISFLGHPLVEFSSTTGYLFELLNFKRLTLATINSSSSNKNRES